MTASLAEIMLFGGRGGFSLPRATEEAVKGSEVEYGGSGVRGV